MAQLDLIKNKIEELPNNIEAEQSIIGSILISNEIFDEIDSASEVGQFTQDEVQQETVAEEEI